MSSSDILHESAAARLKRRGGRRDCWKSLNVAERCHACRKPTDQTGDHRAHVPIHQRHLYCSECCPLCRETR